MKDHRVCERCSWRKVYPRELRQVPLKDAVVIYNVGFPIRYYHKECAPRRRATMRPAKRKGDGPDPL